MCKSLKQQKIVFNFEFAKVFTVIYLKDGVYITCTDELISINHFSYTCIMNLEHKSSGGLSLMMQLFALERDSALRFFN